MDYLTIGQVAKRAGRGLRNCPILRTRGIDRGAPTPESEDIVMIRRLLTRAVGRLENIAVVTRFISSDAGNDYGITRLRKLKLVKQFRRNNRKLKSRSSWLQHLWMAEAIFRVPKSLRGDVVECGCFNGASTASLSLACALTNRRLFVCDSFEGLPSPKAGEEHTVVRDSRKTTGEYYRWQKGEYASEGGLEKVKENMTRYGIIDVCRFVKGYFTDTLKDINTDSIVFVFEDADLLTSVEDCLRYLWPKMQQNCIFCSHEPWSFEIVSLFYNRKWWQENLKEEPPGFFGSGDGVVPGLGCAKKVPRKKDLIETGTKIAAEFGTKEFSDQPESSTG